MIRADQCELVEFYTDFNFHNPNVIVKRLYIILLLLVSFFVNEICSLGFLHCKTKYLLIFLNKIKIFISPFKIPVCVYLQQQVDNNVNFINPWSYKYILRISSIDIIMIQFLYICNRSKSNKSPTKKKQKKKKKFPTNRQIRKHPKEKKHIVATLLFGCLLFGSYGI